jgi:type II secretory ATPase GspE/PulE/Tfp pilus assembly ATPase PilB-like protein
MTTQPPPLPSIATSAHVADEPSTVPAALESAEAPPCIVATPEALWDAVEHPSRAQAARLGEALVARGLLSSQRLAHLLRVQARLRPHRPLGQLLVESGLLSAAQLNDALVAWLGVPIVDAQAITPAPEALRLIPAAVAEREGVLPLLVRGDTLVIAVPDPWDNRLLDELRFMSELRIAPVIAAAGSLAPAVTQAYRSLPAQAPDGHPARATSIRELAAELTAHAAADSDADAAVISESDNALVRLVNRMIADAIEQNASDIHVETAGVPSPVRIRFRVDGDLLPYLELPSRYRFGLVARLKIMADLDISEHRKPQDGKIDFARFGGPHIELRMVTVPTVRGLEDVVLRLLSGLKPLPLDGIGLSPRNLATLRAVMGKAYGLILVCGPTGSGKTTTLHSVMRELNTVKRKIWTAEDPVEITQEGLRQVQVNTRIGWTFAAAMRTFLRADPDIIMIGEMRDAETAGIAVEASLTGHLVMSTLHTNSAPESITRLLEIGIDPFTFSDSLLGILAQRLVRRLCTHCRVAEPMDRPTQDALVHQYLGSGLTQGLDRDTLLARWGRDWGDGRGGLTHYRSPGCSHCEDSGFRGRMGLHELMLSDERVRELVRRRASAAELQAAALAAGMVTLRQDGIEKVLAGVTDLGEVVAASNQ